MPLPKPEPGLVLSYTYLWRNEHEAGLEEGRKARPCVIILAVEKQGADTMVTVSPVTHTPPNDAASAIEIPHKVKHMLGLDNERSWVVLTEVNQFAWPGYDLQPIPGSKNQYAYGFIPPRLFEKIKQGIVERVIKHCTKATNRD